MSRFVNLGPNDIIKDTYKVTKGFFTGNVGTVAGTSLATASLSTAQGEYYYNLQKSSEDQFSVAYGHRLGSGSGDTIGQTKAIYKQFASMLLNTIDVQSDRGFVVKESGTETTQSGMFFIVAERARMQDRINRKNWTLQLSGSTTAATDGRAPTLHLTDSSKNTSSMASPGGPRYEVISGSLGVQSSAGYKHYGYIWPDMGIIALSQTQLSSSIPGASAYVDSGSPYTHFLGVGAAPDTTTDGGANNAGKLVNMILKGGNITMRSEEDQTKTSYFCRAMARDFNFSNQPSYTTGSDNEFVNSTFEGNPQTFITTVGLYNGNQELVATGRLSTPVLKNFQTEATIKVDLTY